MTWAQPLPSPFLQFLLDMNTASSLFDLVISGPISASLANSLSTFAPAAKMLCEENRLRLCGLEKHVCEMIRRDVLGGIATCDTAFVPAGLSLRNFRCAFFDMDSTLIGNECIDELAALYDVKDQVAEITERSMRGELDFEHSLRERVKLLAGAPSSIIDKAAALIRPTPGAKETLALFHSFGVKTYIASGGFTQFAEIVARDYGMSGFVCNRLVIKDGKLTGETTGPAGGKVLDRAGKRRTMEVIAQVNGASLSQCIAGGDGANDLEMIGAAGFGFAYHAKPIVAQAAPYKINVGTFAVAGDWFIESWT